MRIQWLSLIRLVERSEVGDMPVVCTGYLGFLLLDLSVLCPDFTFLSFLNGSPQLFLLLLLVQGSSFATFEICREQQES